MADSTSYKSNQTLKWLVAAVIAAVVLGASFMAGVAAGRWPNFTAMHSSRTGGYMMRGDGMMRTWSAGDSTSTLSRFIGTVTAVNGSDFTLAGGGSSVTVKTTSSTQWHGGNTVKLNDTVAAFGTLNGGDFNADVVTINP